MRAQIWEHTYVSTKEHTYEWYDGDGEVHDEDEEEEEEDDDDDGDADEVDVQHEEKNDVEEDDVAEENRSQNRKPTLCEPAQSKRTWNFHKSHFVEICSKNAGPQSPAQHFVRARTNETHKDISQEPCF